MNEKPPRHEVLYDLMEQAKMNHSKLAEFLEVDRSTMCAWVKGHKTIPDKRYREALFAIRRHAMNTQKYVEDLINELPV